MRSREHALKAPLREALDVCLVGRRREPRVRKKTKAPQQRERRRCDVDVERALDGKLERGKKRSNRVRLGRCSPHVQIGEIHEITQTSSDWRSYRGRRQ
ncbi:MAG: hypothetical protein RMK74_16685 [Myxococcales bacterium]|nr:hypothetical protein [Myxococcales bacterium]